MLTRRSLFQGLNLVALSRAGQLRSDAPVPDLRQRVLGRTGRWVTPLGLGGQASLQWTGAGIDPAAIIVRAVELGVNYLDSANAYGPSQANYGEAFRRLHLTPYDPDYNLALRQHLYFASKTGQRQGAQAVTELKRTLTTVFGDGRGWIPEGAYVDAFQIHNLTLNSEVDTLFRGMAERGGQMPVPVGALPALLDYRDGTDYSGLNPERRRYIRHLGITGHQSSPVLMYALQKDAWDAIDTMLVALNANDRLYQSHQFNAIPLARARGMGIIAMKAFADGVFYGKPARFSSAPGDVTLSVGKPGAVPSADFVRYPLSVPGVSVLITGIGFVNPDVPEEDQLVANLGAACLSDIASPLEMRRIEDDVAAVHGTQTNYFNSRRTAIEQPARLLSLQDGDRVIVEWPTAYAASAPLRSYNIYSGDNILLSLPYRPQLSLDPLRAWIQAGDVNAPIRVVASEEPPAIG